MIGKKLFFENGRFFIQNFGFFCSANIFGSDGRNAATAVAKKRLTNWEISVSENCVFFIIQFDAMPYVFCFFLFTCNSIYLITSASC